MEGRSIISNKLRFLESKKKFKLSQNVGQHRSYKLVASANNHGLIIIGFEDKTIKAVQTDHLLDFTQSKDKASIISLEQFSFTFQLIFKPTLLTLARYGYSSVLFVSGQNETLNCPSIEVFDLDTRESISRVDLNELVGSEIIDYAWHPNYYDSIVALCTNRGSLLIVAIDKKLKRVAMVYNNQQYGALSCCWSPKGKNLAIGMSNGQMLRLEPVVSSSSFNLKLVEGSSFIFSNARITPDHQIVKLRWINKTYLMSVHAKPNNPAGPDTVYSVITIKQSKPYLYWTNICFENQNDPNYNLHLVNLSNSVVCASSASGEAAVIGLDGNEWSSITIDEEGARIELPLDANNMETYPKGVTLTFGHGNPDIADRPILIFYTSDGVICPYAAVHADNILKLPEFQPAEILPLEVPQSIFTTKSHTGNANTSLKTSAIAGIGLGLGAMAGLGHNANAIAGLGHSANAIAGLGHSATANVSSNNPSSSEAIAPKQPSNSVDFNKSLAERVQVTQATMVKEIAAMKKRIEFNEVFSSLLDDINHLRCQFDEIQEIHKIHKEVLDAVKEDIDSLDIKMLENLYLIEYIKSRSKGVARKKSLDPMTLKKVEAIKQKSKVIAERLKDLNIHVDVSWEDFVRRRTAMENKDRRLNSLDMIYKALATNQKIINVLKKRASGANKLVTEDNGSPKAVKSQESYSNEITLTRRELDQSKMRALKEFLSSRSIVPVRRPESVSNK